MGADDIVCDCHSVSFCRLSLQEDQEALTAVTLVQAVFEDVYELDAEGDVNRVLFATKQQLPSRSQLDGTPQAAVQACSRLVGLTRAADQHRTPSSIPADDPLVMQLSRLRLLDAVSSNMQSNGQARGH